MHTLKKLNKIAIKCQNFNWLLPSKQDKATQGCDLSGTMDFGSYEWGGQMTALFYVRMHKNIR
jgi:hypothetical protein